MDLKQSTASQEILLGPFLDDDDGVTQKTGLTIANTDIKIFKAGGTTLGNKNSGGATEIATGFYYATLDATDTDTLGPLVIVVQMTDCLCVRHEFNVVSAAYYDWVYGSTKPSVDVDTIKTQAVTCAAGVTILASVGTAATSTAQTGDSYARLGAPAGASVSADVAAIKAVADTIQADTDLLDDASGGLADIHTDIADLHTDIAAIKTVVDTIQADTDLLDDVSGGLADIHTDVGSVKTVVDAIKLKTDNLPADPADDSDLDTQLAATKAVVDAIKVITDAIGATGSGLTAIPWNAAWDAEVQSECTDALNAYDPPTKAELDSAQAAVTVSAIANNAITAAAIATDAIDADALKADAITEIQNGLATAAALTTVDTVVDLIEDIVRNKMEITDANGNLVLYADDSTTPLYSVAACVTDDLTTTTRKRLA